MADNVDKLSDEDLAALHEMQGQLSKAGDPRAAKLQQYIDTQAPPTKEHGIIGRAWDWMNKGLISGDTLLNIAGKLNAPAAAVSRAINPDDKSNQQAGESGSDYMKRLASAGPDADHPMMRAAQVGLAGAAKDTAETASSFTSPLSVGTMAAGAATKLPGAIGKVAKVATPLIAGGFAGKGAVDVAQNAPAALQGDPDAAQRTLQGGAMVAGGAAGLKATVPEAAAVAVENIRPAGAQGKVYKNIGQMPAKAVNAAEGIFQAAAPTGTNLNFRQNLYTALPDLAEVARKVNLAEVKGGIINPDMRVAETVKAIDAHLKDMYATERAPQIQAHANESVQLSLDPNTRRGLEYLANHAGLAEEQALAAQALKTGKLSVAATDQLAKTANQYLLKYEGGTPEAKAQMEATSPKVGGLKALDRSVGNSLNSVLQAAGEPGLRGYEQRYAALSQVRDGLRPRINAEELKRNLDLGIVGKGIKAVTGGKTGIASASQAAVADVNVGKTLQNSMKTLAESNLQPNRAIRRASPMPTQLPQEQSQ